jgi:hypothetical protein
MQAAGLLRRQVDLYLEDSATTDAVAEAKATKLVESLGMIDARNRKSDLAGFLPVPHDGLGTPSSPGSLGGA